jgi:DNA-binding winged helix-turn-helix (wHTH) protein
MKQTETLKRYPMQISELMSPVGSDYSAPFLVGPWVVDAPSDVIRHSVTGDRRSLEPRIMALLCALAERPGQVLSRDELMLRLWPQVIVNENSLTRAVSDLRKALHSPDYASRAVVTIPKKGYRLDAEVMPAAPSAKVSPAPSIIATRLPEDLADLPGQRPGLLHRAALGIAAVLAFTTVSLGVQLVSQDQSPLRTQTALVPEWADNAPETTWLEAQQLSSRVEAISAIRSHSPQLVAPQLETAAGPGSAIFSRDGDLFAYVSYTDAGSSLILGSRQGFSSPINVYETDELIYNLQWSPVDNVLLFGQKPRISPATLFGSEGVRLIMFNLDTMAVTVLTGAGSESEGTVPSVFSLT